MNMSDLALLFVKHLTLGFSLGAPNLGSFPLTVTVTTMGYRSYKNPLNKARSKDSYWEGE